VWEFKDRGAERATYPTEKNLDLLKLIIKNSSDPGDLILDAFAGSGTTLLAANDLGRPWIGIEASSLGMTTCQTRLLEHSSKTGNGVRFEVADTEEATGGLDKRRFLSKSGSRIETPSSPKTPSGKRSSRKNSRPKTVKSKPSSLTRTTEATSLS
ncbi:MAG: DNA methyltransferase, partial [Rubrobacteraceae bacterium]